MKHLDSFVMIGCKQMCMYVRGGTNADDVLTSVKLHRTFTAVMKNTLKVLQRTLLLHCQQNTIISQKQESNSMANM